MKTVSGTFATVQAAERAVVALERQNYPRGDIHLADAAAPDDDDDDAVRAAGRAGVGPGAVVGAALGAALAVLALLGVVTPAGAGPLFAVGPLFAALTVAAVGAAIGALAGGLVGMAMNLGVAGIDARALAPDPRRAGTRVTVRTDDDDLDTIADTLDDHGAVAVDERHVGAAPPDPAVVEDEPFDERVTAERRAVARPGGVVLAFHEGTFELGELREEARVTREVRVIEEDAVGREARRAGVAVRRAPKPPTGPTRSRTMVLREPCSVAQIALVPAVNAPTGINTQ